jgi:hypothetical protein
MKKASRKNGVEINPAAHPTLSPTHPGIKRQNASRQITADMIARISPPPTAICLARFSRVDCFFITEFKKS